MRLVKRWAKLRWKFVRTDVQKYRLYRRAQRLLRAGETLPQSLISPYLWQAHIDLLDRYEPRPYAGKITLFRAHETEQFNPSGVGIGWEPFAAGGLEVKVIYGTHNIVKEPYVVELARILQNSMEDVLATG